MNKFGGKEIKKIRPIKNFWCDWLINYIPGPKKSVCGFKDIFISLLKTNTPKKTV